MNIYEAMRERHTVRKYKNIKLSDEIISKINSRVKTNNENYNLDMKFITDNNNALNLLFKFIVSSNVNNYILLAGPNLPETDQKLGAAGADIMLYAQTLGLNTWWIGETYNKKLSKTSSDKKIIGVIAIGYGEDNGKAHKSKKDSEVSSYQGERPEWFKKGIEAALLAPTALNKQEFMIRGNGKNVKIDSNNGKYSEVNRGIVRYFFSMGAGEENFKWI
ncbi:MAG: nitroreductase [Lachnospiraceae bacterium]|nr:nitroreductase [Lachnospiraceae bacterium]